MTIGPTGTGPVGSGSAGADATSSIISTDVSSRDQHLVRRSATLLAQVDSAVGSLSKVFGDVLELLAIADATSPEKIVTTEFRAKCQTQSMIRAANELLLITRALRQAWCLADISADAAWMPEIEQQEQRSKDTDTNIDSEMADSTDAKDEAAVTTGSADAETGTGEIGLIDTRADDTVAKTDENSIDLLRQIFINRVQS